MKTKKKAGKILLLLVVATIALSIILPRTKPFQYRKAQELLMDGHYSSAAQIFSELGDYERSEELYLQARYGQAKQYMSCREYDSALLILESLGDYELAPKLILQCRYEQAKEQMDRGEYTAAIELLEALTDYEDSAALLQQCHYELGRNALQLKDYATARTEFLAAGDYEDAPIQADQTLYQQGHDLFMQSRYEEAQACFAAITQQLPDALPHFATLADAADFLAQQQAVLATDINCYVGSLPENCTTENLWDYLSHYIYYEVSGNSYSYTTKQLRICPQYYSGDRILYAWRNDDTSILTDGEKEALKKAKSLVSKAKKSSKTDFGRELYLYNWLCNNVKYKSPNMDVSTEEYMKLRQLTCVGALVDGKANCQGYTDAFYLLGTMAGLDVYRFRGEVDGEGHAWNGIMLDGKLYIVDVTFGDADNLGSTGKTYTWLNCSYDQNSHIFDGGTEAFPELVQKNDVSKTYYKNKKSVFTKISDAALYLLKQHKKNGKGWTYAMVKGKECSKKSLENALGKNYRKAGLRSYSCTYVVDYYQGNTYIAIKWK